LLGYYSQKSVNISWPYRTGREPAIAAAILIIAKKQVASRMTTPMVMGSLPAVPKQDAGHGVISVSGWEHLKHIFGAT
jgi:hypothetical protein